MSKRQELKEGKITEDEYFIEYGKNVERIRILDILQENLPPVIYGEMRNLIKENLK